MATPFLDAAARAGFERAVQAIETASAAEIVIALRRRSAGYLHANVAVGAVVALAGLAAMLFSDHVFALSSILVDPFVVGALAGAAVELMPGVKRTLTPRRVRRRAVLRAARATFVERGVHHTRDRSGILLYVSALERELAMIADTGIAQQVAPDELSRVEQRLATAMASGGAAVARALEQLAPVLGAAMPCRDDDRNELPDVIDSNLPRNRRPRGGTGSR